MTSPLTDAELAAELARLAAAARAGAPAAELAAAMRALADRLDGAGAA